MSGAVFLARGGTINCGTVDMDRAHHLQGGSATHTAATGAPAPKTSNPLGLPECTCGHLQGDHQSAGIRGGLHASTGGLCLAGGCGCRAFVDASRDVAA